MSVPTTRDADPPDPVTITVTWWSPTAAEGKPERMAPVNEVPERAIGTRPTPAMAISPLVASRARAVTVTESGQ